VRPAPLAWLIQEVILRYAKNFTSHLGKSGGSREVVPSVQQTVPPGSMAPSAVKLVSKLFS